MIVDIDSYFGVTASAFERLRTNLALRFALRGCQMRPHAPQRWAPHASPLVDGLELLEPTDDPSADGVDAARDLVVSTVRMGYGHHRIALSVGSWAGHAGRRGRLLDLLATSRDESRAIRRMDEVYSRMSRLSAELGGPFEALWGRLMQSGGLGALRLTFQMAAELQALLDDVPRDAPFVSAYPLNGHLAVRLGFRRVINLIFDNDPQHFLVVPGALNLVQSPASYERVRALGVPRHEVALAGHWVSRELVEDAATDSEARIARAGAGAPRRFALAIGGAGAQKAFVTEFVQALRGLLHTGRARLLINLGDHAHLRAPFEALVAALGVSHGHVHGYEALAAFCDGHPLHDHDDGDMPLVTLFTFDAHLEAVRATDRLMRIADVLVTKPSELAFVPVPKLHIRRVGDHEAISARRSAELGDGTLECREVADAVRMATWLTESDEFLTPMNARIAMHAERGVYSGSKRAVELALG